MKKSVLTITIATTAISLVFSGSANAGPGIVIQGVSLNGWSLNGPVLRGTTMQATKQQGMELQSLKVEGGQLVAVTQVAAE